MGFSLHKMSFLVLLTFGSSAAGQIPSTPMSLPNSPSDTHEIRTLGDADADRINQNNARRHPAQTPKVTQESNCLFPPLSLVKSPAVTPEELRISNKAKQEYGKACSFLRKRDTAKAENHLRTAVRLYPKYPAAWVTLGELLASQKRMDEAQESCAQGVNAAVTYVPAYLCLAELAAKSHAWEQVLNFSEHALQLAPSDNAIAYVYHAAANLNLHKLPEAEKSGLRAIEIDKNHREPRAYFVLAQIYEARKDPQNEAAQLREYLKYAKDPEDVAAVNRYLSGLEAHLRVAETIPNVPGSAPQDQTANSAGDWAPADVDEAVPAVLDDAACPLPQILRETSGRTQDLIENLLRFSADEHIEQVDLDKSGKKIRAADQVVNYVAQIERNSGGYPSIQEYRYASTGVQKASVMDSGAAVFALIFHPTHVGNFEFRCEGLTQMQGSSAWQLHFEESPDPNQAFTAIWVGGQVYLPRFKGRAWIAADSYNVLRIETDLVSPISKIGLQLEHQIIDYAPVEFPKSRLRLWLPASTSLYLAYQGHRSERNHSFDRFQLFSVDSAEAIKDPTTDKNDPLPTKWLANWWDNNFSTDPVSAGLIPQPVPGPRPR